MFPALYEIIFQIVITMILNNQNSKTFKTLWQKILKPLKTQFYLQELSRTWKISVNFQEPVETLHSPNNYQKLIPKATSVTRITGKIAS